MEHTTLACKFSILHSSFWNYLLTCHSSLETPWVEEMITKYHDIAKSTGAIVRIHNPIITLKLTTQIIPTIALAPSDLVSYLIAREIHAQPGSLGTAHVNSTAKLEYVIPSSHSYPKPPLC